MALWVFFLEMKGESEMETGGFSLIIVIVNGQVIGEIFLLLLETKSTEEMTKNSQECNLFLETKNYIMV